MDIYISVPHKGSGNINIEMMSSGYEMAATHTNPQQQWLHTQDQDGLKFYNRGRRGY